MQEMDNLFNTVPYKSKAHRGEALRAEHAQEAIEDILSDNSVFLNMPKIAHILKARAESSYGSHKLIVTLKEGVSYPEYMLSGRVAALAPKLVNIFFDTVGFEEEEEILAQMQYANATSSLQSISNTTQSNASQTPNITADATIVSKTRELLGVTYQELGEMSGYDAQELTKALSLGKISRAMHRALELCLENVALKKELQSLR